MSVHKKLLPTENMKQNMHTGVWGSVGPFSSTPVSKAHKVRTLGCHQPFHLMYRYQKKEKYKKGMDRNSKRTFMCSLDEGKEDKVNLNLSLIHI